MDFRAVIMAGGTGTRFWPLSREKKPKQFLPIVSEKSMIQETVERLLPLVSFSHIYTIANREHTQTIHNLIPEIPETNLLVEPQGKNTAPSLILATAWICLQNPKAVVAALPADHLIKDFPLFLDKLEAAAHAASTKRMLITFGIPPSYPATGYGYIQFQKDRPHKIKGENFYHVREFKEKPDLETAKAFLTQGSYFWNSGMFIWQASVFEEKLKSHAPEMFFYWEKILAALKKDDKPQINAIFDEIPSISIDYALMEKAEGVLMGEGNFGWSDVGAWSSLVDIWLQDEKGNALKGENIVLDIERCILHSPNKLTALIGVKDLIVVDTEDVLLICHKGQDQKVKEIVDHLQKKGKKEYF
jgi:mannose-1-phosphate guanylyltransferase